MFKTCFRHFRDIFKTVKKTPYYIAPETTPDVLIFGLLPEVALARETQLRKRCVAARGTGARAMHPVHLSNALGNGVGTTCDGLCVV